MEIDYSIVVLEMEADRVTKCKTAQILHNDFSGVFTVF